MITHGNLISSAYQYMIFGQEVAKVQGVSFFLFHLRFLLCIIASGLEWTGRP